MQRISHGIPLDGDVEEAFSQIEEQLNSNLNNMGAFLIDNIEIPSGELAINKTTGDNVFDVNRNYDEKLIMSTSIGVNTATDPLPYNDNTPPIGVLKMTSEFKHINGGGSSTEPQIKALPGGGFQILNPNSSTRYIRTIIRILEN